MAILCNTVITFVVLIESVQSDDVFTNRFSGIRFSRSFVDKTRFISEVFKHKYLFMNAPKHFGKSVNMGMLNMFFSNLRTKETIEEYFNGTEIWNSGEFVDEHLGKYPVILYNASGNCVVHDEDHMKVTILWTLFNMFSDHAYLLSSPSLSNEELNLLRVFLNEKMVQNLGIQEASQAITFLAKLLHRHHGKNVILLADDFGCGIMGRMIDDNLDLRYLTARTVNWYSSVIKSILENQQIISHVVMSGETWLYGLSDPANELFQHIPFMESKDFVDFYGFTYTELQSLFDMFDISEEQRARVVKWYCGYSSVDGRCKVCNPSSIMQYLSSPYRNIKAHWSGSPIGPDLLQRMVGKENYGKHLKDLAIGRPISISVDAIVKEAAVPELRRMIEDLQHGSESFISRILLEVGYLTFSGQQKPGTVELKFPNEEIRSVVDKFVTLLSFI